MTISTPPLFVGATKDREFVSSETQAGRPAILILADQLPPEVVLPLCSGFEASPPQPRSDVLLVVDSTSPYAYAYAQLRLRTVRVIYVLASFFRTCRFEGKHPAVLVLDREMRGVTWASQTDDVEACVRQSCAIVDALPFEEAREIDCPAPVLMIRRILSTEFCDALIGEFETNDHRMGGMASVDALGRPIHKIDTAKKHRRDHVLPDSQSRSHIIHRISELCVPQIKKAFAYEAHGLDRLLVARYDDTGGYFRRHRDNAAPSVAHRRFAISINLNDNYGGGHLMFPEYNDHLYRPGKGDGIVFSASLLHEAAPVTTGQRYVLLSFFNNKEEGRMDAPSAMVA